MDKSSPRLLKTFTSVKAVSALAEGSKYMLLNLASIKGTKVKEIKTPQIAPSSIISLPYFKDMYRDIGIAIQVRTFQKLSIDILDLFGELLISTCLWLAFKLYKLIILKLRMICKGIRLTCIGFFVLLYAFYAHADEPKALKDDIKHQISIQEKENNIPSGLLFAIARVESGIEPYALNIRGKSLVTDNRREALSSIYEALAAGITNIDVGVMQLNVKWHSENFNSVEDMLEPRKNIEYAARFLVSLYKKHGDWHKAVRFYHSSTAEYYRKYSRKITLAWIGS
jgi:hypothetical protein